MAWQLAGVQHSAVNEARTAIASQTYSAASYGQWAPRQPLAGNRPVHDEIGLRSRTQVPLIHYGTLQCGTEPHTKQMHMA